MISFLFVWIVLSLGIFNVYAQQSPSITQFLVFASSSETTIEFQPKDGWILNEEKSLRLFITGANLQNSSVVFSASPTQSTSVDFISPVYRLSSQNIIKLNIKLKPATERHATVHLCLLPALRATSNRNLTRNGTILNGPYYTFIREKGTLPFPLKVCLILMLFTISGFFR